MAEFIPEAPGAFTPVMDGYAEMGNTEELGKLYAALAAAQASFGEIHRSRTVSAGSYSFRYAPLEDLLAATRPALAANGLAVLTPIVGGADGLARVMVVVAHRDGGRLIALFAFKAQGQMKDIGGQITYVRRYGYSAMLNLAADDDEDERPESQITPRGNQRASSRPPAPAAPAPAPAPAPGPDLGPAVASDVPAGEPMPSAKDRADFARLCTIAERDFSLDVSDYEIGPSTTLAELKRLGAQLREKCEAKKATSPASPQPALR